MEISYEYYPEQNKVVASYGEDVIGFWDQTYENDLLNSKARPLVVPLNQVAARTMWQHIQKDQALLAAPHKNAGHSEEAAEAPKEVSPKDDAPKAAGDAPKAAENAASPAVGVSGGAYCIVKTECKSAYCGYAVQVQGSTVILDKARNIDGLENAFKFAKTGADVGVFPEDTIEAPKYVMLTNAVGIFFCADEVEKIFSKY